MTIWIVKFNKSFSLWLSSFISLHFSLVFSRLCFFCSLQPRFIFNWIFYRSNFFILLLLSYLWLWRIRCISFTIIRLLFLNLSLLIDFIWLVSSFRCIWCKCISSNLIILINIIVIKLLWRLIILCQWAYCSIN